MTTIGFIGAGNIGQAVARLAVDHGYDVVMSNSRGPQTLTDVVDVGPLAESWRIEPDTPGYGPWLDAKGMRMALTDARR